MKSNIPICSSIIRLFFSGCPAAVSWPIIHDTFFTVPAGVMAVIVFSVDRVTGTRTGASIGKEVLKGMRPSNADSNTSFSIQMKRRIAWICCSRLHGKPRRILRSLSIFSRHSMSCAALANKFPMQTATALTFSYLQQIISNIANHSTLATTVPAPFIMNTQRSGRKHRPTSEGIADFNGRVYNTSSHARSFLSCVVRAISALTRWGGLLTVAQFVKLRKRFDDKIKRLESLERNVKPGTGSPAKPRGIQEGDL